MGAFIDWINENAGDTQVYIFFGLLFIFMGVEYLVPKRKTAMRRRRWGANFGLTFINIVVLSILPVTFITAALYAEDKAWGLLPYIELPFIVLAISSLLLRGFISFFTHYLMHKVPLLWRLHRVHHLDTELDISTTVRFHPLEFIGNLIIGIPMILGFGLSAWALLFYELFDAAVTLVSHANISFPWYIERWLRYIIVTPDLHRVHHSSHQPETDSNFSAVFPIWDILFGTFRTETLQPQEEMELGLEEVRDERTNRMGWLLLSPFKGIQSKNAEY